MKNIKLILKCSGMRVKYRNILTWDTDEDVIVYNSFIIACYHYRAYFEF